MKPCACGCGELVPEFDNRGRERNFKLYHGGKETRIKGGDKHPSWKGGRRYDSRGYVLVRCVGHPRQRSWGQYIFEHILVMEEHLGRYLTQDEVVHHINENPKDNRIENLQVMTKLEHNLHHNPKRNLKV